MTELYIFIYTEMVTWSKELVSEVRKDVICISANDSRVKSKLRESGVTKLPLLYICRHINGKSYTNIEYDLGKIREYVL